MDNNRTYERIAILESQTIQTNVIVEKLETTIDKLSEVSSSLKEMIVLNAHRIEQVEADIQKSQQSNDLIENEHDKRINELKEMIMVVTSTIDTHLKKETSASQEQNQALLEIKNSVTKLSDRVGALEKWRWLIVGGAGVVYFLFTFGTKMLTDGYTIQPMISKHPAQVQQHKPPEPVNP